jgi:hypothetical protein
MIKDSGATNKHDEESSKVVQFPDRHKPYNEDRLEFPKYLSPYIGLSKERINWMKHQGCKFFGRKTKIRWINEFLEEEAAG